MYLFLQYMVREIMKRCFFHLQLPACFHYQHLTFQLMRKFHFLTPTLQQKGFKTHNWQRIKRKHEWEAGQSNRLENGSSNGWSLYLSSHLLSLSWESKGEFVNGLVKKLDVKKRKSRDSSVKEIIHNSPLSERTHSMHSCVPENIHEHIGFGWVENLKQLETMHFCSKCIPKKSKNDHRLTETKNSS